MSEVENTEVKAAEVQNAEAAVQPGPWEETSRVVGTRKVLQRTNPARKQVDGSPDIEFSVSGAEAEYRTWFVDVAFNKAKALAAVDKAAAAQERAKKAAEKAEAAKKKADFLSRDIPSEIDALTARVAELEKVLIEVLETLEKKADKRGPKPAAD